MDGDFPGPKGLRERVMRDFAEKVFGRARAFGSRVQSAPTPELRPPGFLGSAPPLQGLKMETHKQTERRTLYEDLRAKVRGERLGLESVLAKDYEAVRDDRKPPAPANDQKRREPAPLRAMLYEDLRAKVSGRGSGHESLLRHDFDRERE